MNDTIEKESSKSDLPLSRKPQTNLGQNDGPWSKIAQKFPQISSSHLVPGNLDQIRDNTKAVLQVRVDTQFPRDHPWWNQRRISEQKWQDDGQIQYKNVPEENEKTTREGRKFINYFHVAEHRTPNWPIRKSCDSRSRKEHDNEKEQLQRPLRNDRVHLFK